MIKKNNSFQNNCDKWSLTDPQKAVLLPYVEDAGITFVETAKHQNNLKFQQGDQNYYLHSQDDVEDESSKWFESLDLKDEATLYVYGIGLGYYYQAAINWLHADAKRRLIFIEDNLAIIRHFFETPLASQLLEDPQVELYYYQGFEEDQELFNRLYWKSFLTTVAVSSLNFYKDHKKETFDELKGKIEHDVSLKDSLLREYMEYGVGFYKNFYPNMLHLEGSYLADGLAGKFKNIPAIICGAGPSLEKNLEQLKTLGSKALIFAGGSALNALNVANIRPHFGAGIDPNAAQYDRLSKNTAYEVPFLYRNRLFHDAFKTIHGPHLYVTGSGGYDVAAYFENKLDIQGIELEEGHNVVNFCLEVAHIFGCNPIIFVGMDLGYTGMKAYAPGIVEDNVVNPESLKTWDPVYRSAVLKTDIFGNPLYTRWMWMAESNWISDFAKEHPDIKVFNATEGGLGFQGVPNLSLNAIENDYMKENYDFIGMVHSLVLNCAMPQVKTEKVIQLMNELKESLLRSIEALGILIEESGVIIKRIKKEKTLPFPLQTGRASLYETDLAEEAAYQHILHIFNEAYTRVLNRELQDLNNASKKISEKRKALGKIEILNKRFAFLRDVARVNVELMDWALRDYRPEKTFSHEKPGFIMHKEGDSSVYKGDGRVLSTVQQKEGYPEGEAKLFYSNGQLYSSQFYKKGLMEGKQEYFYPDGTPKTWMEFKDGVLLKAILYNSDGTIKHQI